MANIINVLLITGVQLSYSPNYKYHVAKCLIECLRRKANDGVHLYIFEGYDAIPQEIYLS